MPLNAPRRHIIGVEAVMGGVGDLPPEIFFAEAVPRW